jgi:hypothetical protein
MASTLPPTLSAAQHADALIRRALYVVPYILVLVAPTPSTTQHAHADVGWPVTTDSLLTRPNTCARLQVGRKQVKATLKRWGPKKWDTYVFVL